VAESLEAVTLKLLAKNPVNRYPTAEDLRSDLRRYREGAHDLRPAGPAPVAERPAAPSSQAGAGYGRNVRTRRDDGLRRTLLFTVVLAILLVVLGYLVVEFVNTLGVNDEGPAPTQLGLVEVPILIGTPLDEAREILREARFSVQIDYEVNADFPENTVFDQQPSAGTRLEQADTVRLLVSRGTGPMVLLAVVGDAIGDAIRDLEAMGLVVSVVDTEDPVVPAGQVIDQSPPAGAEIVPGSRVIVFVSSGPAVEEVPDLANRPVLDAMNIISQLGWQASTVEEPSQVVPEGQVIRTEPPARSALAPGSVVQIVVSAGIPMVVVPPVVSLLEASAVSALEAAGFEVNVLYETLPTNSPNSGRVISQSPMADAEIELGSSVAVVVGATEGAEGEVSVDGTGDTGDDSGDPDSGDVTTTVPADG
jgi:serine/threonine-protein kinase